MAVSSGGGSSVGSSRSMLVPSSPSSGSIAVPSNASAPVFASAGAVSSRVSDPAAPRSRPGRVLVATRPGARPLRPCRPPRRTPAVRPQRTPRTSKEREPPQSHRVFLACGMRTSPKAGAADDEVPRRPRVAGCAATAPSVSADTSKWQPTSCRDARRQPPHRFRQLRDLTVCEVNLRRSCVARVHAANPGEQTHPRRTVNGGRNG